MIAFAMALMGCVLIMYKAIWYDQFTCPDGFLLRVRLGSRLECQEGAQGGLRTGCLPPRGDQGVSCSCRGVISKAPWIPLPSQNIFESFLKD